MKHILFSIATLVVFTACNGQTAPAEKKFPQSYIPAKPLGWTSDFAKIFTAEEISYLDSLVGRYEAKTSNEIAIVSIDVDSTVVHSLKDFEELTLTLFNHWGVGKKEKNNGVAIIIAPLLRKVRIETGRGLEQKLTNAEAKSIIDNAIVPQFKNSNYFRGTVLALSEIFKEIE